MHKPLIVGNWKLNGSKNMIKKFVFDLKKVINRLNNINLVIAPPLIYLDYFYKLVSDNQIFLAAQNVDVHNSGAFTGEISAEMLKDIGVKYVIIGHSERRIFHDENENLIAKKFSIVKDSGLIPIICIGETSTENKNGQTEAICIKQINSILKENGIESLADSIIAYEPIWAIGTGKSANLQQIQYIIKFIRNYIANKDINVSKKVIIQYGGSVNKNNAQTILNQPDIDGLLVGSSSLNSEFFYSFL